MTNPLDDAIQAGGDFVDEKTDGKFDEQVDKAQEGLGQKFGDSGGDIEGPGESGDSGGDIEGGDGGSTDSGGDIETDPRN